MRELWFPDRPESDSVSEIADRLRLEIGSPHALFFHGLDVQSGEERVQFRVAHRWPRNASPDTGDSFALDDRWLVYAIAASDTQVFVWETGPLGIRIAFSVPKSVAEKLIEFVDANAWGGVGRSPLGQDGR